MATGDSSQLRNVTSSPENGGVASINAPTVNTGSQEIAGAGVTSRVREVVGELPQESSGGATGKSSQKPVTLSPLERKEMLLARLPKDEEEAKKLMQGQLESHLKNRLASLEDERNRAEGSNNYYEMNQVMRMIREFRTLLEELATYAFAYLQGLWLRFVHNLTV